jgi:nitrogen fixation/metabolism regulation signal transduction histidine kinase
MDEVVKEANALREQIRGSRIEMREATALVRAVTEEIDLALFVVDPDRRLRFVNRRAERLLERASESLLGRTLEEAGLGELADDGGGSARAIDFPGGAGRFTVKHIPLRERGLPYELIAVADIGRTLRDEERQAWQRLIRVLGHEVRNSLAPIHSIASTLRLRLARNGAERAPGNDLGDGLAIIEERSFALSRFLEGYSALARLPKPAPAPLEIARFLRDAARLETRVSVAVQEGPALTVRGDRGQLEQVLINLLRNAADAALETGGEVRIGWGTTRGELEVRVEDEGPGLAGGENLFVPFFTTKANGTGIGLVLSRQIAEAHGGSLTLENRRGATGCVATLRLPL